MDRLRKVAGDSSMSPLLRAILILTIVIVLAAIAATIVLELDGSTDTLTALLVFASENGYSLF